MRAEVGRVVIVARNAAEARAEARRRSLRRRQWSYAGSPHAVEGARLRPADVVAVPGWEQHRQAVEIQDVLRLSIMKTSPERRRR